MTDFMCSTAVELTFVYPTVIHIIHYRWYNRIGLLSVAKINCKNSSRTSSSRCYENYSSLIYNKE